MNCTRALINDISPTEFLGKRVIRIENESVNYFVISFDDGSEYHFETVPVGHGIYGVEIEKTSNLVLKSKI